MVPWGILNSSKMVVLLKRSHPTSDCDVSKKQTKHLDSGDYLFNNWACVLLALPDKYKDKHCIVILKVKQLTYMGM